MKMRYSYSQMALITQCGILAMTCIFAFKALTQILTSLFFLWLIISLIVSLLVGLLLLCWPFIFSKKKFDQLACLISGVLQTPVFITLWLFQDALVPFGTEWQPFRAHVAIGFIIAILTPGPFLFTSTLVTVCFAIALIQYTQFNPEQLARVPISQPWPIIGFYIMAMILLIFRTKARRLLRASLKVREEARMTFKMMRILSAIRDLTNTPLQLLAIDIELMQKSQRYDPKLAERLQRTLKRMLKLSQLLKAQLVDANPHDSQELIAVLNSSVGILDEFKGELPSQQSNAGEAE